VFETVKQRVPSHAAERSLPPHEKELPAFGTLALKLAREITTKTNIEISPATISKVLEQP